MSACTSLENGALRAGTQWLRRVLRSEYEGAREKACDIAKTEAFQMLFAHPKRILGLGLGLGLGRLRLRGPYGANDEIVFAAIAQNVRKL